MNSSICVLHRCQGTLRPSHPAPARVWNKALWGFDQEKLAWFHWGVTQQIWQASEPPRLLANKICGTGTRSLSDAGRAAIESVFESSFSSD